MRLIPGQKIGSLRFWVLGCNGCFAVFNAVVVKLAKIFFADGLSAFGNGIAKVAF